MKWYDSYGFENTYAFMVRKDFAQKNNLKKSCYKLMIKSLICNSIFFIKV